MFQYNSMRAIERKLTLHLVLERLYLRVRIVNQLIHLLAQCVVLLGQAFRQVLLIDDFLGSLVAMKCQPTARALHDDRRTQTAENACLVVLGRI